MGNIEASRLFSVAKSRLISWAPATLGGDKFGEIFHTHFTSVRLYNASPFCLDKTQLAQLKRKVEVYKAQTKIKKQIFLSLITAGGVKTNDYAKEFIASFTVLEDLF
jgi:hypothetical protein